jgi:glutathione synthase/RimK-type ligase-like ATP-grasp enzyme
MADTALYIEDFFSHEKYSRSALIFQAFVEAEKEFRVMVLDGQCLGMAEKSATGNQVARNASLGNEFIAAFDAKVADFAVQNTSRKGILGADVLLDTRGRLYLLEANRAPQWQAFEKATGINVAACIIQKTWQRVIYAFGKWQ